MTNSPQILGESRPANWAVRAWRSARERANVWHPQLWISYVIERDLRMPIPGPEPAADMELKTITAPGQDGYEDMVRMSRRIRVRRELCELMLSRGAVGVLVYVIEGGQRRPAGIGWMTQFDAKVPFLNARFTSNGRACLLYQDFVLPEFRGRKLQQVIGKRRLILAAQNGAEWAYGYIRRANIYSLRNAIGFHRVGIVHNLHIGEWMMAHVCATGKRTCADLPFRNWPVRRSFYIKPTRD